MMIIARKVAQFVFFYYFCTLKNYNIQDKDTNCEKIIRN